MLPGLPSWGLLLSQVAGVAVLGCCRCAPGVIGAPGVVLSWTGAGLPGVILPGLSSWGDRLRVSGSQGDRVTLNSSTASKP